MTGTHCGRTVSCRAARAAWLCGALLLAACSHTESAPTTAAAPVATPVDPATAGVIQVDVRYDGTVPVPKELVMRSAPQCAAAHPDPVYEPTFQVHDGHLANAVVWIKGGLEQWRFAVPSAAVVIDQTGCTYQPHVAAAMVHQPVQFINSDPEAHNVHGRPQIVSSWNFMMSRTGATRTLTFDKPEIAIPIGCDIHPWMSGFVAVVAHPYFAVTPASGSVTLSSVPPGDYVIAAWHEKLGTREQRATLAARGSATVHITFAGS